MKQLDLFREIIVDNFAGGGLNIAQMKADINQLYLYSFRGRARGGDT